MRAVIMAGGRGTRMRPYTTVLPKPLLPVGDQPILAILLEQLAAAGVQRIDLCLGYLGELIRAYLADASLALGDAELRLHTEREPLGTAGALLEIDDLEEPFLSLNGDVLTALDFGDLMRAHHASGAAMTIATQVRETVIGAGVLTIDGTSVQGYTEKPVLHHHVSLGIYAISPSALASLPGGRSDIPELSQQLVASGAKVESYRFDGPWYDVGTRSDHERASQELQAEPARFFPLGRATPERAEPRRASP